MRTDPPPAFPTLFSPLRVGGFELRNRLISTSHDAHYAMGGVPTERYIRYLEAKARGGAAMVQAFGSTSVDPLSPPVPGIVCNWDDTVIEPLAQVAERIHAHGALITCQLVHYGRWTPAFFTHSVALAPSDLPHERFGAVPRSMTTDDIEHALDAYAAAARRCVAAGLDGVEIAIFADMLPDQFLSPTVNTRTDEYGGDFERRLRFPLDLLRRVRAAIGPDPMLVARISADDLDPGGLSRADRVEVARRFDQLGVVDLFSVTAGTIRGLAGRSRHVPSSYFPRAVYLDGATEVRRAVRAPVLYAGRVVEPGEAEQILAAGSVDLVGMTRALIADPDLPAKARQGLLDDIRYCAGANECIGRLYQGMDVECVQNPVIGREAELGPVLPAERTRHVVVVGGGPGGLEAARLAALRGHRVTLLERTAELGGQVRVAARAPGRAEYAGIVDWLARQVGRAGVQVSRNTHATADSVLELEPDVVVVATGSRPRALALDPDGTATVPAEDVLTGRTAVDGTVLVIAEDPFIEGPTTADYLAERGHRVLLCTPHYTVADGVDDTLKPVLLERLHTAGVQMYPLHEVTAIAGPDIVARHVFSGIETKLTAGTVVVSAGRRSVDGLAAELAGRVAEIHLVGDALSPRRVHDAMLESARLGRVL